MNTFQQILVAACAWFALCVVAFVVVWLVLTIRNAFTEWRYNREQTEEQRRLNMACTLRREGRFSEYCENTELTNT